MYNLILITKKYLDDLYLFLFFLYYYPCIFYIYHSLLKEHIVINTYYTMFILISL
jgi:hypothetical protein